MRPEYPNDRDYFFDSEEIIYQVIGYNHPMDSVFCLQKYSPLSKSANDAFTWKTRLNKNEYIRVIPQYSSSSATTNIRDSPYRSHSELYGVDMIQFPVNRIKKYFHPRKKMQSLIKRVLTQFQHIQDQEKYAVEISHLFENELGILNTAIGVTGSILWEGVHKYSDIDIVIYGLSNTRLFFHGIHRLIQSHYQLRSPNLTEQLNLAHRFSQKSGLTLEDCTVFISKKKFLLYFSKYVLSIAFNPDERDLKNNTLAFENTNFVNVSSLSNVTLKATVADDSWMYFYPGVIYLMDVKIIGRDETKNPFSVCRAVIFEHENVGYYKKGDKIEIRGLIQKIMNPPPDALKKCGLKDNIKGDFFQIIVGTSENYGNEYVKNLEI